MVSIKNIVKLLDFRKQNKKFKLSQWIHLFKITYQYIIYIIIASHIITTVLFSESSSKSISIRSILLWDEICQNSCILIVYKYSVMLKRIFTDVIAGELIQIVYFIRIKPDNQKRTCIFIVIP